MIDTPRTDSMLLRQERCDGDIDLVVPAEFARILEREKAATCAWHQDGDGPYDTDCGHRFEITDGTPAQNRMKFCAFCGKTLVEVAYVDEP